MNDRTTENIVGVALSCALFALFFVCLHVSW